MPRISRWRKAPGQITATVGPGLLYGTYHNDWSDDDGRILPRSISEWLRKQYPAEQEWGMGIELTIAFESSGYYDPGRWYERNGDPGYPPEGDDEREIVSISTEDGSEMPVDLHNDAWEFWEKQIYAAEVDATPDYDEPEYA